MNSSWLILQQHEKSFLLKEQFHKEGKGWTSDLCYLHYFHWIKSHAQHSLQTFVCTKAHSWMSTTQTKTHTHKHTLQSRLALVFARLAPFAPPTQYCHILACHMDSETDKAALSTTGWGCVCARVCVCIRAQVCAWEWERVLEFRLRLSRQRQTSPIKSPSSV